MPEEKEIEVVFREGNYDDENPVYPFRRNAQGTIDVTKLRGNVYSYDREDLGSLPFNMVFSPRFSFCLENLCIYEYVEDSVAVVDGDNVIMPEGKVGRWLKYLCLGGEVPVSKNEFEFKLKGIYTDIDEFYRDMETLRTTQTEMSPDWMKQVGELGYIANKPDIPIIPAGIVIDPNYTHTDNNFSNIWAQKLSEIEAKAQVNKIEAVSVNGTMQEVVNKQVNVTIPYADDIAIWHTGEDDPNSTIGKVNDWYVNIKTQDVFKKYIVEESGEFIAKWVWQFNMKGKDGTSISILGSYNTYGDLIEAHPTGNAGDMYVVNGNLYVWSINEESWKDVGGFKGEKGDKGDIGEKGTDGTNGTNGTNGIDGKNIEIQNNGTFLQWRFVGDATWINLVSVSELKGSKGDIGEKGKDGVDGTNGKNIEIQTTSTHIQWRVVGDGTWIDLIEISTLKGTDGANGTNGIDGANGKNIQLLVDGQNQLYWRHEGDASYKLLYDFSVLKGKNIELQRNGIDIQWRVVGDANWQNLIAVSDLKGAKGDAGANGKKIELNIWGGAIYWGYENTGGEVYKLIDLSELKGVKGDIGLTGATPNISVSATTLAAGSQATVVKSGNNEYPTFTFGIPAGAAGANGKNIELQVTSTHVQWRVVGDASWNNLIALSLLTGASGSNGETPKFQMNGNMLQYRFATQSPTTWTNLYSFTNDGEGLSPADLENAITAHNTIETAHPDIRAMIGNTNLILDHIIG